MNVEEHLGTVTQKGQVTIPLAVRKLLGVKPRDRITFRVTEGRDGVRARSTTLEAAYGAVKPTGRPETSVRDPSPGPRGTSSASGTQDQSSAKRNPVTEEGGGGR